jgi:hypothetical protein
MQHNYSHDNDGAGYLLAQYRAAPPFDNNVVRYNISQNDGRRNNYGGIVVWSWSSGEISNSHIYNNTVYLSPTTNGNPCAIRLSSPTSSVSLRNNIIFTTGGAPLLCSGDEHVGLEVQGYLYWSNGYPFRIRWGSTQFGSLAAFRGTGQESLRGVATGMYRDPLLESPGQAGIIANPSLLTRMTAYRLRANSPLIDRGLNLRWNFGIAPGARDFFGTSLPQGQRVDIGAHEFVH